MRDRLPKDAFDRMTADQFLHPAAPVEPRIHRTRKQRRELAKLLKGNRPEDWWEKYHRYIDSPRWKKFKLQILAERGSICERCGKFKRVDLHHISYAHLGNEERDDVKLYCRDCHDAMHPRKNGNCTLTALAKKAAAARWANRKKGK